MLRFYIEFGYMHPASGDWIREHQAVDVNVSNLEEMLDKERPYMTKTCGMLHDIESRVISVELLDAGKENEG